MDEQAIIEQNTNELMTYEEVQEVLTELADELPEEIYRELNGGILLQPNRKIHPEARQGDLFIMGEYCYRPHTFGRYVVIYYGSFSHICAGMSRKRQEEKLKEVLYHELTHHLEILAGDKSLEKEDAAFMKRYKNRNPGR